MKVNMTPNPLDVVTIHASQGDTEARQWEFELHNNGELIDTSNVTEQMFFKAYKGGTEQLLPENTSTPTTSPFKGDIKYPQGLLTDQEFTYRQSPTEEDGLAKITDIKGNTLVWNQLITDPNFTDVSKWRLNGNYTSAIANNELTLTVVSTDTNAFIESGNLPIIPNGHKFFFRMMVNPSVGTQLRVGYAGVVTGNPVISSSANTWTEYKAIVTSTTSTTRNTLFYFNTQGSLSGVGATIKFKQATLIDLTQMGLDSLTVEEFTSLFPLSYYSYNQGSLLSFMGNGIKTVGKNQSQLVSMTTISGGYINASSGEIATVKKGITYTLSFDNLTSSTSNIVARIQVNGTWIRQGENNLVANSRWALTFTATDDGVLGLSAGLGSQYSEVKVFDNIQLEFGSTATDYEPYTSSTLSLPISTYFPSGMKSAGNVYDELTESKAISRVGSVDLGSLAWTYNGAQSSQYRMTTNGISSLVNHTTEGRMNIICEKYDTKTATETYQLQTGVAIDRDGNIVVYDPNYNQSSSTSTFKTAMNGVMLYYELATETETSFATASLVTETTEIPLSNNDGVLIGKCTEELSENPGFFDAKIKLADADGECYSNKIQLHVERSPQ